jgi:hypothetical protein
MPRNSLARLGWIIGEKRLDNPYHPFPTPPSRHWLAGIHCEINKKRLSLFVVLGTRGRNFDFLL